MRKNTLVADVSSYVTDLYEKHENANLLYHNLEHTRNVLQRTYEIAGHYEINKNDNFILTAAAWFHDTGHLFGIAQDHERRSVSIMRNYLELKDIETEITDAIAGCIMATKIPQEPKTLLEEIICDADTYNLGTDQFVETDELLKKEFELRNNCSAPKWAELTLNFFIQHSYFTSYCKASLNKQKLKNIEVVFENLTKG